MWETSWSYPWWIWNNGYLGNTFVPSMVIRNGHLGDTFVPSVVIRICGLIPTGIAVLGWVTEQLHMCNHTTLNWDGAYAISLSSLVWVISQKTMGRHNSPDAGTHVSVGGNPSPWSRHMELSSPVTMHIDVASGRIHDLSLRYDRE